MYEHMNSKHVWWRVIFSIAPGNDILLCSRSLSCPYFSHMIQRNIKDLQSFEADSVIFTWEFKRQIHFTKFGDNSKKSPIKAEGQSETTEIEFTQFSKSLAYRWKRKPSANNNTLPHCLRMKFFVHICICSICGFIHGHCMLNRFL